MLHSVWGLHDIIMVIDTLMFYLNQSDHVLLHLVLLPYLLLLLLHPVVVHSHLLSLLSLLLSIQKEEGGHLMHDVVIM